MHCWTWYYNSGDAREEIDHVLLGVDGDLSRTAVFRSAEFPGTDYRILVVILKLRLKSREMAHPTKFG